MLHVNAFIVVGRGETQMTPIVRYTYSGDTYSSRVLGICHITQITDQLKSIGCEKIVILKKVWANVILLKKSMG